MGEVVDDLLPGFIFGLEAAKAGAALFAGLAAGAKAHVVGGRHRHQLVATKNGRTAVKFEHVSMVHKIEHQQETKRLGDR